MTMARAVEERRVHGMNEGFLPGVAAGCRGRAPRLLASCAYRAHKRNRHLRAAPALSLHPGEKSRKTAA